MSSWARVGVKCVCVDGSPQAVKYTDGLNRVPDMLWPIEGTVYTVRGLTSKSGIYLCEMQSGKTNVEGVEIGYKLSRFRPLHTIESDAEMIRALVDGMGPLERLDRLGEMLDG